jgi:uncharacterized delta-60 repeat protein
MTKESSMTYLSRIGVAVLAIGSILVLVPPALADPSTGYLDRTFSDDGKILTDVAGNDIGEAVAVQADGKIVAVGSAHAGGDIVVARYDTDGAPDDTFGTNGIVVTDIASDDAAFAVAIQDDQEIDVAGFVDDGASAAVLRYDPDGSLDSTFGGGDGVATMSVGAGAMFLGIAIQPDDSIVATGTGNAAGFGSGDALIARFDPTGAADATFGGGDGFTTTKVGVAGQASGIAIQDDGAIVVAGWSYNILGNSSVVVLRYDSGGSLDPTFSGDGKVKTVTEDGFDRGSDVVVKGDGSIVVVGSSGYEYGLLAGYTSDGSADTTFGDNGIVLTDLGGFDGFAAEALQDDGAIVAVGTGSQHRYGSDSMAVARYLPDGTLDPSFGGDGVVFTAFGIGPYDEQARASGVALQSDDKIVVVGTHAGETGSGDLALARYGTIDTAVLPQPDLLLGRRGDFVGDDRYNTTGHKQTIHVHRSPGRSIPFRIQIQNDGNATDTVVVTGGAFRRNGFRVDFFDHGDLIPLEEIFFEGHQEELAVGASATIKMVVTISRKAEVGSVYRIPVRGESMDDPSMSDVVVAMIKVV